MTQEIARPSRRPASRELDPVPKTLTSSMKYFPFTQRSISLAVAALVAVLGTTASAQEQKPVTHQLTGWASLPSSTRWPGPVTGQFISPDLPIDVPFADGQPIPGFSALLKNPRGGWIAMPDNGFGTKGNSGDFIIGVYRASIDFKSRRDGTTQPGMVALTGRINFNDAQGLLMNGAGVDLAITADLANYHTVSGNDLVDTGIPVDSAIARGRLLTGFDFDVESIAAAPDGTYWVGEEFGPWLLHFDAKGSLIDEPVPHPFLLSPSNPKVMSGQAQATQAGSRGFESLAFNGDYSKLYAVPEAAPLIDSLRPVPGDERVLNMFEFDPVLKAYTGRNRVYRKDGPQTDNRVVIGDMSNVEGNRFVLIERDSLFGVAAQIKRLYLIDLDDTDDSGLVRKRLLVDLLNVSDARDIGGPLPDLPARKFNFPFDSVESVVVLDDHQVVVAIDTNYPDEDGRVKGRPDDTEVIRLVFPQSLAKMPIVPKD